MARTYHYTTKIKDYEDEAVGWRLGALSKTLVTFGQDAGGKTVRFMKRQRKQLRREIQSRLRKIGA